MRYFLMVAEEQHFGRAAQRLNIVQPALSMQIKVIEGALGAKLFDRSGGRIELTDVGRHLLPEVLLTVAQAERTREIVPRLLRGEVGVLRVGFFSNAVFSGKLQAHVEHFRRTHAGVEIVLEEMNAVEQLAAIRTNAIDIGYCTVFGVTAADITVHRIATFPWRVALAETHPLAHAEVLTPEHIRAEKLILYAGGKAESGQVLTLRTLLGTEPEIFRYAPSTIALLASVAIGLGVALVPATLTNIGVAGVVFRPIVPAVAPAELHLIARKRAPSPLVDAYIESSIASDGADQLR
ncbi:LysR substrate-binding domain-containing protein [Sphingomonas echinoides]|uniref:LysR substrate-binding domain-containing protein n=1 Tax=Sphingomonas echinoides TaxID=59803 RepID=UPI0024132DAE|nr:LysR substrate-binding domain-containing protein [Sphingomonas echinoides]